MLEWAEQQRAFTGHVLVVWAREDKLMPPEHAERLADCFENTELVWVDDSSTLIPINQPEALTAHLERFLERYALRISCPDAGDRGISVLPSVQPGDVFQYAQRHVLNGRSPR